jgi:hypothetical protein
LQVAILAKMSQLAMETFCIHHDGKQEDAESASESDAAKLLAKKTA